MEMKDLAPDAIYVGDGDFADIPGYLYIRGLIDGRIGFSVLDDPLEFPDFTDCGVYQPRIQGRGGLYRSCAVGYFARTDQHGSFVFRRCMGYQL